MPELEHVPTDRVGDDLVRTYRAGARRLELQVRQALEAGLNPDRVGTEAQVSGDATAAYRARQLRAARLILGELEATGRRASPGVTAAAYSANLVAIDRTVKRAGVGYPGIEGRFGGIHQRAVENLAANMSSSLSAAARRAGENLETVFSRANVLEGALPVGGSPLRGFPFIGRRVDDAWRRVALETIGAGTVGTDTRRQISRSMARRLINDGVTDALTGYVDRAGRRWGLAEYATMVTRTTTREATSRAAAARLGEHGLDLVTISSHPHASDECDDYDGQTFSLSGNDDRYDALDVYPPFHPNCRHVMTPAAVDADDYLSDLNGAVDEQIAARPPSSPARVDPRPKPPPAPPRHVERPTPPPTSSPPAGHEGPPLGGQHVRPHQGPGTAARLDAQREGYAFGDPGPEPGAAEAWAKYVEREGRHASKALDSTLGDFNAKWSKRKWATDQDLRGRVLNGDLSIEEAEDLILDNWQETEGRRLTRHHRNENDYGYRKRSIPCFNCGWLKRRPADVCDHCGDDPVSVDAGAAGGHHRSTVRDFNRAYGFAD